jgi:hypothetical protein
MRVSADVGVLRPSSSPHGDTLGASGSKPFSEAH